MDPSVHLRMSKSSSKLRNPSPLEVQRRATQQQILQTNLTVLVRHDPSVLEILDMAGHVVVYSFDMQTQGWKKQDIEGSLFVIRRNSHPTHRLFVLNRSALHNYVQDITADMLTQVEGSYLILRPPGSSSVVGMWFYKDGEHAAVSLLVQSIVQYLADNPAAPGGGGTPGRPGRPPLPQQQQQQQQQRAGSSNEAGAALMGLLGQGTAPQSPPMTGASDALKGMLGIAQPQGAPTSGEAAGAHIMGMLNLGGGGGGGGGGSQEQSANAGAVLMGMIGAGAGGGGAPDLTSSPSRPVRPPGGDLPQPPQEPPSPGKAIMAMLGNFPSATPPAPPPPSAGTGASILAAIQPQRAESEDAIARRLLTESVEETFGKAARVGGAVMPREMFGAALEAAVKDEAFMGELYNKYLALAKA